MAKSSQPNNWVDYPGDGITHDISKGYHRVLSEERGGTENTSLSGAINSGLVNNFLNSSGDILTTNGNALEVLSPPIDTNKINTNFLVHRGSLNTGAIEWSWHDSPLDYRKTLEIGVAGVQDGAQGLYTVGHAGFTTGESGTPSYGAPPGISMQGSFSNGNTVNLALIVGDQDPSTFNSGDPASHVYVHTDFDIMRFRWSPTFTCAIRPHSATELKQWYGIASGPLTGAFWPEDVGVSFIGFMQNEDISTKLLACVSNGSVTSYTELTNVTWSAGSNYYLKAAYDDDTKTARFYVTRKGGENYGLVAEMTDETNNPVTTCGIVMETSSFANNSLRKLRFGMAKATYN